MGYELNSSLYYSMVLWELAALKVPFSELTTTDEIKAKVLSGGRLGIEEGWCSPKWRDLIIKCWNHYPAERPNVQEIVQILEEMSASRESDFAPNYSTSFDTRRSSDLASQNSDNRRSNSKSGLSSSGPKYGLSSSGGKSGLSSSGGSKSGLSGSGSKYGSSGSHSKSGGKNRSNSKSSDTRSTSKSTQKTVRSKTKKSAVKESADVDLKNNK